MVQDDALPGAREGSERFEGLAQSFSGDEPASEAVPGAEPRDPVRDISPGGEPEDQIAQRVRSIGPFARLERNEAEIEIAAENLAERVRMSYPALPDRSKVAFCSR